MTSSAIPRSNRQEALADFLARCDPAAPPPDQAYVPRVPAFAPWLATALRKADTAKVLVMGQNGVGKTTELGRLGEEIGQEFYVCRPPIDQVLDLGIVSWHDLFVFAALWAGERVHSTGLDLETLELNRALVGGPVAPKPGAPPEPSGLQWFRNDPRAVHKKMLSGPAQFWDLAVSTLRSVEAIKGQPVLLVLDGLEKLSDAAAKTLFHAQRRYVTELPCRAVVTAPLSLSFEPVFGEVEEQFLTTTRLRAISHRPGEPGVEFFLSLAKARGSETVVSPEVLRDAVSWGGGLPRQFLQLLAAAATQALTDGLERVEPESFARGRMRVTERWQYQLEPADYEALTKEDRAREAWERARLLRLGALVEYDRPGGGLGLGVNPLVGALLTALRSEVEGA